MSTPKANDTHWRSQRVIPVLTLESVEQALALVRALVSAGLPRVEVTLRTAAAIEAVRALVREVPQAEVGVGTIRSVRDLQAAVDAGARFLVSPGHTEALLRAGRDSPVPYFPGAVSGSEIMTVADHGFEVIKFFPAEPFGGIKALAAYAGPFAGLSFMPTGGINAANFRNYLALPNVLACGGSWMVPADRLAARDFAAIEALARACAGDGLEEARS